jgi:pyridoxal 5'-phosphate synthase pdxS subunit
MDVTNAEQARIAEQAGAVSVMALERVPSDIRRDGGVARMAAVSKIREIQRTVSIPVMARRGSATSSGADPGSPRGRLHRRVGGPDPGDEHFHIDKLAFASPLSAVRDLGRRCGGSARARR